MIAVQQVPTAEILATATSKTKSSAQPRITKAAAVLNLLTRPKGATVAEMTTATGWQPHSIRAFLSGLRKKDKPLLREERKSGETSYRLTSADSGAAAASGAGAEA